MSHFGRADQLGHSGSAGRPAAWHAAVMAARTAGNPPATRTEPVAPVTIVVGEEEFLVDRAVRDLIKAAAAGDVHDRDGAELGPGELDSLTSPSLFGGGCAVVISPPRTRARRSPPSWPPTRRARRRTRP